ncbi:hypothetical protein GIB67_031748 [Kingdonia uniflora]|uniref:Uncharacterized protein n=1 Tax=Kingdonia uniflora TaxID=39325 RepID=A0A7J7NK36_9MAGN|nr:hypothetical protein GIB67_031748 [Kingdonia uniflora]
MLNALPASDSIGSSEVVKEKRRRVKPSGESGNKVAKGRPTTVDDLKEVEERTRLAALHGEEDTSKMLQVEARANLDEKAEEHDNLGCHLMLKGYSEEEVDAIKVDTYVEEGNDEEVEVVGVVDGLDGVFHQTVLDSQWDNTKLLEGDNEKVELDSARSREDDVLECNREYLEELDRIREANKNRDDQHVKVHFKLLEVTQAIFDLNHKVEEKDAKGLKELVEMTEHVAKHQSRVDALMVKSSEAVAEHLHITLPAKDMEFRKMQPRYNDLNERVVRLKTKLVQATTCGKKTEARERSEGSKTEVKALLDRGDVVSQKLDTALIREKVLEGEIKAKETLMKMKEELLKEIPASDELSVKIERLRAQVVDLGAQNLGESAKYIKKLEENTVHDSQVKWEMAHQKYMYARLELRLEKVREKFATMVIHDVPHSDLLKSTVAYFVEEVKRLKLEQDTLFKSLSDMGCICRVSIDRGNCLASMETHLGTQSADLIERDRIVVIHELNV